MADLSITHVINVSLILAQGGLSAFNVANLAVFTDEQPAVPYTGGNFGIYYSAQAVGKDYGTASKTYRQAVNVFSQRPNILAGGGYLAVIPMAVDGGGALTETLTAAIARARPLVSFYAIICNATIIGSDWTTAQAAVQATNNILGRASYLAADVAANTGPLWQIMNSGDSHTRAMYYGNAGNQDDANEALAAALSRAMGVDFSGSNTVNTADLKTLQNVPSDASMSEPIYTLCQNAGVLCYPSMGGVPGLQDFNANGGFFDEIFNSAWFQGAINVAGFNVLKQTGTKVFQTDNGVDTLVGAYRKVCLQGQTNGFIAPGAWTSPDTFGDVNDFHRNIEEQGFYLFALPVAQQSPTDRAARKAPVCQIAIKEAGAIHSSNVIVNINA